MLKTKFRIVLFIYSVIPVLVLGWYGWHQNLFMEHDFQAALILGLGVALVLPMVSHLLPGLHWIVLTQLATIKSLCREIKKGNYIFFEIPNPPTEEDEENELNQLMRDMNWMIRQIRSRESDLEEKVSRRTRELTALVDELKIAKEAAVASDKAKSAFLANMSHEIKTPMNAILGMTELLDSTRLDSTQKMYLETVAHATGSLLRIIDDILDFSKAAANKMTLESIPFSIHRIMEEVEALFRENARRKRLFLELEISPTVASSHWGDPFRLKQVVSNLVSNAFKFTEKGGVKISVEQTEAKRNEGGKGEAVLRFAVHDTGIGIAATSLDTIFFSFSQAEDTATRKYGGSGLGLAICRQLVQLMGGRIWVESVKNEGSSFYFTLALPICTHLDKEGRELSLFSDEDLNAAFGVDLLDSADSENEIVPLNEVDWPHITTLLGQCSRMLDNNLVTAKVFIKGHLTPLKETVLGNEIMALEEEIKQFDFHTAREIMVQIQKKVASISINGTTGVKER